MSSTPNLLFLHTSETPGLVAARHDGRIEARVLAARGLGAPALLAEVEAVLAGLGLGCAELDGVVVSIGPGSFTGIRVGIATALGLSIARGWRPWVCDSLIAEAIPCAPHQGPVAVCHDARRGEVYAALYEGGPVPLVRVAPFCATPRDAASRLQAMIAPGTRATLVGSGAPLLRAEPGEWDLHAPIAPREQALAVFGLVAQGGLSAVDPMRLGPLYIRNPDIGRAPLGA